MSAKPLPEGWRPSAAQVTGYLETAALDLERMYVRVNAALTAARLWATQRMDGETPAEEVLAALRSFHQHCRAMEVPSSAILEDLVVGAMWAEGVSWDALGVPLVDTEKPPADIEQQVEEWLTHYTPGVH